VDAHVGRALEHEDRLLLARVVMHDRGLARLVAGDLRPELIGLEQHLAHALVGCERFERVQIEDLGDTGGGAGGDLIIHSVPPSGRSALSVTPSANGRFWPTPDRSGWLETSRAYPGALRKTSSPRALTDVVPALPLPRGMVDMVIRLTVLAVLALAAANAVHA